MAAFQRKFIKPIIGRDSQGQTADRARTAQKIAPALSFATTSYGVDLLSRSREVNPALSISALERVKNSQLVQFKLPVNVLAHNQAIDIQKIAKTGVQGNGNRLPHFDKIQTAFEPHGINHIQAYTGQQAIMANDKMSSEAYATNDKIAFKSSNPTLHTVAHEVTHVMQQQAGVQLKGHVGKIGDPYERQADAVADLVVQGKSALSLLGLPGDNGNSKKQPASSAPHNPPVQMAISHKPAGKPVAEGRWARGEKPDAKAPTRQAKAKEVEAVLFPAPDGKEYKEGKATANGYDPPGWDWLELACEPQVINHSDGRTQINKHGDWVRFHLLNHHLGGDGHDPLYLVPALKKANSNSNWRNFEDGAKSLIGDEKKPGTTPIHYYIEVNYYQEPALITQAGERYLPFFPNSIVAQYTPWETVRWGTTKNIMLDTSLLEKPPLEAFDRYYLTTITQKNLTDLGVKNSLSGQIAAMKDEFKTANTLQDVYDTLIQHTQRDSKPQLNIAELHDTTSGWKIMQDAFQRREGKQLRISIGKNPRDMALTHQLHTLQTFSSYCSLLYEHGAEQLSRKLKVPKELIRAISEAKFASPALPRKKISDIYTILRQTKDNDDWVVENIDKYLPNHIESLIKGTQGPSFDFIIDDSKEIKTATAVIIEKKEIELKGFMAKASQLITNFDSENKRDLSGDKKAYYEVKASSLISNFNNELKKFDIKALNTIQKSISAIGLGDILDSLGFELMSPFAEIKIPAMKALTRDTHGRLKSAFLEAKDGKSMVSQQPKLQAPMQQLSHAAGNSSSSGHNIMPSASPCPYWQPPAFGSAPGGQPRYEKSQEKQGSRSRGRSRSRSPLRGQGHDKKRERSPHHAREQDEICVVLERDSSFLGEQKVSPGHIESYLAYLKRYQDRGREKFPSKREGELKKLARNYKFEDKLMKYLANT